MKKTRRRNSVTKIPARVATTLGELISAAYEAADGFGNEKLQRAADILSATPLAQRLSRQVEFVR